MTTGPFFVVTLERPKSDCLAHIISQASKPDLRAHQHKMDSSDRSQSATEAYEIETKEMHETTWSSRSSSNASLRSTKREESPDSQNDHTVAFADLEPTASRSIPPPPRSQSAFFDPGFEIKWEENDVENPKNWSVWRKAHTIFACTVASCTV